MVGHENFLSSSPFIDHDHSGAIPEQYLDPVATFDAEHNYDTGMGIEAKLVLHDGGKTVMNFAKINKLGRHNDFDVWLGTIMKMP